MKKIIAISLALLSGCLHAEPIHKPVHECAERGIYQAKSLLEFHFGPDDRIDIDENVTVLPPIKNPSNKKEKFDVLEFFGSINRGSYRIRLLYAPTRGTCVLVGQEVLEE